MRIAYTMPTITREVFDKLVKAIMYLVDCHNLNLELKLKNLVFKLMHAILKLDPEASIV